MKERKYFIEKFYSDALPLENSAEWGMSLKKAGSMRFRWNENNPNRNSFLKFIAGKRQIAAVELIHSQIVYAVDSADELQGLQGDGIITDNPMIMPVVTVADCMPIYLFEKKKGVFGVLHSGWKGTGIVKNALEKAAKVYGTKNEDFHIVLGPHIHDCCYTVDEERAQYFRVNFSNDCVSPVEKKQVTFYAGQAEKGEPVVVEKKAYSDNNRYRLSLARANLAVLKEAGVPEEQIVVCKDCTCCNAQFGSFRRETIGLSSNMSLEEKQKHFTVQAAFIRMNIGE